MSRATAEDLCFAAVVETIGIVLFFSGKADLMFVGTALILLAIMAAMVILTR